jgi:glutamine amidotransferase
MIGIIDYGLGNVQAFLNIYKEFNVAAIRVQSCDDLRKTDRIILPGVGSFDWSMEKLNSSGLRTELDDAVRCKKKWVLGVCVGMQMMARSSEEGQLPGLAWVPAVVQRFDDHDRKIKLPHMGWNDVDPVHDDVGLFKGISNPRFYFLHSYCIVPESDDYALSRTQYAGSFVSAIRSCNVLGTQFHPEKRHGCGMQLLKNFAELPANVG